MILYYIIFITSYLFCLFDFAASRSIKFLVYLCFCTCITLIVGFREVGLDNDSIAYQEMFGMYRNSTFDQIIAGGYGYAERGYVFLNRFIALLGGNYRVLFVVMAIATALVNYSYFWKKSDYLFLSLLFYISFFYLYRDFTQIRYALSAAICLWSMNYYFNKQYIYALITFILAIGFHNSAIILLLAILILRLFKSDIWYIIVPIPCIFIGKLLTLPLLFSVFGNGTDHMDIYLKDESLGSASISLVGYCLCLLYFFLTNYKASSLDSDSALIKTGDYNFKLVSIAVAMNFLFINISIFQRFSFILFQFAALLIAIIISLIGERVKERYLFLIFYLLIASFLLFYGLRMINVDLVRPYNFSFYD